MSVKVIFGFEEVSKEKSYPKLMINYELIVFFIKPGIGIVINPEDNSNKIGDYSEDFQMQFFKEYNGEITLKNE